MSEMSFRQAWRVLQDNAQKLRTQTEPNIDELLDIVTASIQAHKVCESRIQAVEMALDEALKSSGVERPAGSEAG
jgi:exodeoxyribonuclease VII small subunit